MSDPSVKPADVSIDVDEVCTHFVIRRLSNKEVMDKGSGALKPIFVCDECNTVLFINQPPNRDPIKLHEL